MRIFVGGDLFIIEESCHIIEAFLFLEFFYMHYFLSLLLHFIYDHNLNFYASFIERYPVSVMHYSLP